MQTQYPQSSVPPANTQCPPAPPQSCPSSTPLNSHPPDQAEQAIYQWFVSMEGWRRLNLITNLLYQCHPLELRFLVSCAEDMIAGVEHTIKGMKNSVNFSGESLKRKLNRKRTAYNNCLKSQQYNQSLLNQSLLNSQNLNNHQNLNNQNLSTHNLSNQSLNGHHILNNQIHNQVFQTYPQQQYQNSGQYQQNLNPNALQNSSQNSTQNSRLAGVMTPPPDNNNTSTKFTINSPDAITPQKNDNSQKFLNYDQHRSSTPPQLQQVPNTTEITNLNSNFVQNSVQNSIQNSITNSTPIIPNQFSTQLTSDLNTVHHQTLQIINPTPTPTHSRKLRRLDEQFRYELQTSLALLSTTAYDIANILYEFVAEYLDQKILAISPKTEISKWYSEMRHRYSIDDISNLLLLSTMVVFHPAFTCQQKEHIFIKYCVLETLYDTVQAEKKEETLKGRLQMVNDGRLKDRGDSKLEESSENCEILNPKNGVQNAYKTSETLQIVTDQTGPQQPSTDRTINPSPKPNSKDTITSASNTSLPQVSKSPNTTLSSILDSPRAEDSPEYSQNSDASPQNQSKYNTVYNPEYNQEFHPEFKPNQSSSYKNNSPTSDTPPNQLPESNSQISGNLTTSSSLQSQTNSLFQDSDCSPHKKSVLPSSDPANPCTPRSSVSDVIDGESLTYVPEDERDADFNRNHRVSENSENSDPAFQRKSSSYSE